MHRVVRDLEESLVKLGLAVMERSRRKRVCNLKWLVKIVKKNGPVSLLPEKEREAASELVVELRLCDEGIYCWQVKRYDPRDRIAFNSESREIESYIQIKYANYATANFHGFGLKITDRLKDAPEKPDYIILYENPSGKYRYLVLTNAEMTSIIDTRGKRMSSDKGKTPRIRIHIPKSLIDRKHSINWEHFEDKFKNIKAHPKHRKPEER